MVKIKVIHASKLLAAAAAVILAIALIVLAVSASSGAAQGTSGERAAAVAAFSFWRPPKMEFELPGENEHADLIVLEDAAVQEDHTQPVERPRVLIYHTHTHEAYAQTAADPYRETESWRTEDQTHSVVRVGEALAALLTDYGFDVVHDTADYEYPKLNTAYARSLDMLETKRGETFNLCVDLHRDAWDKSMAECACIGSQRAAQLMMLIGNGGNACGLHSRHCFKPCIFGKCRARFINFRQHYSHIRFTYRLKAERREYSPQLFDFLFIFACNKQLHKRYTSNFLYIFIGKQRRRKI